MSDGPILELRSITKRFPGVVANDGIDFDLLPGEVHALLGENGAGKSTLMNIVYGLYKPDEGEILIRGKPVTLGSAREAITHGIGMVHQHFMLIPVMTVAENIVLASEPTHGGVLLDYAASVERVRELSERFGLAVDPEARVENIGVGQEQRVEIVKALYRGAEILILDEPTAVLTPQEAAELFEIVRGLQAQGKSIIFISHKLKEVIAIADRVAVLRGGRKVADRAVEGTDRATLAEMMVGREVTPTKRLAGGTPEENARTIESIFRGEPGAKRDVVLLNAGAALLVAGAVEQLEAGIERAALTIDAGLATELLGRLRAERAAHVPAEAAT